MNKNLNSLKFGSGLAIGLLRGCTIAISLLALANIVFSGALAPYVLSGTGMFLIGTSILSCLTALFSKFPAPVATSSMPVVLAMAVIAEAIDLQGLALFHTFIIAILGCAIFAGLMFWLLGSLKVAEYLRYVPFSVSAAALAGSGLLLLLFALRLAGLSWQLDELSRFFESTVFWKGFLSVSFGIGLLLLNYRLKNVWTVPVVFVAFILSVHLLLWGFEFSDEVAITDSLFFDLDLTGNLLTPYFLEDLHDVHWITVLRQSFNGVALFIILLILTVVSLSQLELGTRMDLDWNKEFKVHGVANFLSGAAGGIPGGVLASVSLPNVHLRANTPVTSITIAVVLVCFAVFGSKLVNLIPIPAISGFLITIAIPLINDWLIKTRKKLPRLEYCVLIFICLLIVLIGFFEAIILGLIISLLIFVIRLSRVEIVRTRSTLREIRSHTSCLLPEELFDSYGDRVRVYRLQGYLFVGNTHSFFNKLKQVAQSAPQPVCLIIDLVAVNDFDISATDTVRRFCQFAEQHQLPTIFSSAPARFRHDVDNFGGNFIEWLDVEESSLQRSEEILLNWHKTKADS